MNPQDCTAVEVDGATTKTGWGKKCRESTSHELLHININYNICSSYILNSGPLVLSGFYFEIWHHPFKFQAICTNSFPTSLAMLDSEGKKHRELF